MFFLLSSSFYSISNHCCTQLIAAINICDWSDGREPIKVCRSGPKFAAVCFNKAETKSDDFS